jgi:hypothetical protein
MFVRAVSLSLLSFLVLPVHAAGTAAGAGLAPRPGLWAQTITGDRAPTPIQMKICVGVPEPGENPFGPQSEEDGEECPTNEIKRTAGGLSYVRVCRLNPGTMTSKGTVTGDLNTSYRVAGTVEVAGVKLAPGESKLSRFQASARYLGACPAGMEPGDTAP